MASYHKVLHTIKPKDLKKRIISGSTSTEYDIYLAIVGRSGFTDKGFDHYMRILDIIRNKMFNPEQPESKFAELCVAGKWDYAKAIADTRNKDAIEYCDMFRKFVEHIKRTPEYIENNRDIKINKIIEC